MEFARFLGPSVPARSLYQTDIIEAVCGVALTQCR